MLTGAVAGVEGPPVKPRARAPRPDRSFVPTRPGDRDRRRSPWTGSSVQERDGAGGRAIPTVELERESGEAHARAAEAVQIHQVLDDAIPLGRRCGVSPLSLRGRRRGGARRRRATGAPPGHRLQCRRGRGRARTRGSTRGAASRRRASTRRRETPSGRPRRGS